ncbi:hypothetical protein KF913_05655 [Candidatus Obscuribacterales bacterium]|nr:hypothetical protein [Candidatus Obscuribacterales bacterium]
MPSATSSSDASRLVCLIHAERDRWHSAAGCRVGQVHAVGDILIGCVDAHLVLPQLVAPQFLIDGGNAVG